MGSCKYDFMNAVKWGKVEEVKECLEINKDYYKDSIEHLNYFTALIVASEYNRIEIAKLLLESGAKIEKQGGAHKYTPLIMAAEHGNPDMVKLLLDHGANINATTLFNDSALMKAITGMVFSKNSKKPYNDYIDVVQILLEHGADPNHKNKTGKTPLHYVIQKILTLSEEDTARIITLLIHAGADIYAKDNDGQTPVSLATKYGQKSLVDLMLGILAYRTRKPLLAYYTRHHNNYVNAWARGNVATKTRKNRRNTRKNRRNTRKN